MIDDNCPEFLKGFMCQDTKEEVPENLDMLGRIYQKISDFELRIEKLEAAHVSDLSEEDYSEHHEEQENAHSWLSKSSSQESHEAICNLNDRLRDVERFQDITHKQYQEVIHSKAPHKCPVCNGLGNPDITSLTSYGPRKHMIENDPCNSCEGKGILWG